MTRPELRRPRTQHIGAAIAIVICAALSGCASSSDQEADMTNATGALNESLAMVEGAVTASGGTAAVEVDLASSENRFGAPDGKLLAIEVSALIDEPVDPAALDRIKEQWVEEFGYTRGTDEAGFTRFTKGDRTAFAGNNAEFVGGTGRTWFAVTTEFFDPDAARAAVGPP